MAPLSNVLSADYSGFGQLRFWPARNVKKGGKLMGFDLLLIDEKSTLVQDSINVIHLPSFEKTLKDGLLYAISGFEVTKSNPRFKLTDFYLSIRFTPTTFLDVLDESFFVIPKEYIFRFRTYRKLMSLANTNVELPNVMGQVCSTQAYHNEVKHTLERMSVVLRLESGENARLTAFDEHTLKLKEFLTEKDGESCVILATNVNPKIKVD